MAGILGWKDILRPIRDGYRHLFPPPDTGPTPEERRQQRQKDRLKGFTYFDTIEQLESWNENDSDPLQRVNTPLLRRLLQSHDEKARANLLICHDYAGNYHEYEDAKGASLDEPMYSCEYLQHVDTFVYFSHKMVCVPPPTWTNTLHRNGVRALGTLLLEPQTKEAERLLQHDGQGEAMTFNLAKKLIDIARHYGFDGWLINIERPFPKDHWSLQIFQSFLLQLRNQGGVGMKMVWYDALTVKNEVQYQNELNALNIPFAQACGCILTNYCWGESQAKQSKLGASQHHFSGDQVLFGIDVWAQNSTKLTQPRITYPKRGGGGTNTGIAVAKLAEMGLSAGVFAPAWSFEHFPTHGMDIERAVWEGAALPADLTCSCGNAVVRHQPTQGYAIVEHATVFPAGSEDFFFTDMSRAFRKLEEGNPFEGGGSLYSQLGTQSILPLPVLLGHHEEQPYLCHRLEDDVRQFKLVVDYHSLHKKDQVNSLWLPLYKLNMPADGALYLRVLCRNLKPFSDGIPNFYLEFGNEDNSAEISSMNRHHVPFLNHNSIETITTTIKSPTNAPSARLTEIGIHLNTSASTASPTSILEIMQISITPVDYHVTPSSHVITNIHLENRGEEETAHARLCWDIQETQSAETTRDERIPYSEITGPFSYFLLEIDGNTLGRAYAVEHVLRQEVLGHLRNREVSVRVTGVGFDGRELCHEHVTIKF